MHESILFSLHIPVFPQFLNTDTWQQASQEGHEIEQNPGKYQISNKTREENRTLPEQPHPWHCFRYTELVMSHLLHALPHDPHLISISSHSSELHGSLMDFLPLRLPFFLSFFLPRLSLPALLGGFKFGWMKGITSWILWSRKKCGRIHTLPYFHFIQCIIIKWKRYKSLV